MKELLDQYMKLRSSTKTAEPDKPIMERYLSVKSQSTTKKMKQVTNISTGNLFSKPRASDQVLLPRLKPNVSTTTGISAAGLAEPALANKQSGQSCISLVRMSTPGLLSAEAIKKKKLAMLPQSSYSKLNLYLKRVCNFEQCAKLVYGIRKGDIVKLDTEEYLYRKILVAKKKNDEEAATRIPLSKSFVQV